MSDLQAIAFLVVVAYAAIAVLMRGHFIARASIRRFVAGSTSYAPRHASAAPLTVTRSSTFLRTLRSRSRMSTDGGDGSYPPERQRIEVGRPFTTRSASSYP